MVKDSADINKRNLKKEEEKKKFNHPTPGIKIRAFWRILVSMSNGAEKVKHYYRSSLAS